MNPVKEQKTIFSQAQESMRSEEASSSNNKAETGIMLGLALSSLFTIIYMVVALGGSLLDLGWTPLLAYAIGALLGLAAIMPGEAAVWIWKTKLQSDYEINGTQVTVAWISGLAAAISAAISTVSFFAYLLQGLMPGWYNADTAAGVNVANIAIGWAVFGMAVFIYYAAGDSSKRNRARAKALHVARTAQDQMIAGIAQGTKDKIEELIQGMGDNNIFVDDALEQVAKAMGLNEERTRQVRGLAKGETSAPTTPAQTRQKPYGAKLYDVQDGNDGHWVFLEAFHAREEAVDYLFSLPAGVYRIMFDGHEIYNTRKVAPEDTQPTRPTPAPQPSRAQSNGHAAGYSYPDRNGSGYQPE